MRRCRAKNLPSSLHSSLRLLRGVDLRLAPRFLPLIWLRNRFYTTIYCLVRHRKILKIMFRKSKIKSSVSSFSKKQKCYSISMKTQYQKTTNYSFLLQPTEFERSMQSDAQTFLFFQLQ
jgi:hypothetical protein